MSTTTRWGELVGKATTEEASRCNDNGRIFHESIIQGLPTARKGSRAGSTFGAIMSFRRSWHTGTHTHSKMYFYILEGRADSIVVFLPFLSFLLFSTSPFLGCVFHVDPPLVGHLAFALPARVWRCSRRQED